MTHTMPLVLQPTMDDATREDYEAWLETVRARRLTAAIEYMEAKKLKLDREADLAQKRLGTAIDQLGKALTQMEKLDERVQDLLVKVEGFRQEIGFVEEMQDRGLMPSGDEDDDDA